MKLVQQTYGVSLNSRCIFGKPIGVWLECTKCYESQKIVGSELNPYAISNKEASKVFRGNGWTGKGDSMKKALCPRCSKAIAEAEEK